jgi:hypothetical protein
MALKTMFIFPMNEGQELNYIETYKGDLLGASKRAKKMATELQAILKDGTIIVEVQDDRGNTLLTRLPSLKKLKDVV